jgi:DNA-binding XRE family transcriptional regulator
MLQWEWPPVFQRGKLEAQAKGGLLARTPIPTPKTNRLPLYLAQIQDYWFHGPQRKFAKDAGVSESTLSRILHGRTNPRYDDICKIVGLLEKKLGRKIDPREVYEP